MTDSVKILSLENRINLLRGRDPVVNEKIIRKLERQLRTLKLRILANSF